MINYIWDYAKKRWYLIVVPVAVCVLLLFMGVAHIGPAGFRGDIFGYIHEVLAAGAGFYFFFRGFETLRARRLVENIPTSKIRSVAMGLAEIAGLAKDRLILRSPLSGAECVYYKFLVEQERRGSKGRTYWEKVDQGESTDYFYAEDLTGKILVDPLGGDKMLIKDYEETRGTHGSRSRYTEWYIKPGDYVYVLGTVRKFQDNIENRQERVMERLRALKRDAEKLKNADADKDGQISVEEWDEARMKVEQEVLEEELKNPPPPLDDLVLTKGESEETFIVCDRDEKDVMRILGYKSCAEVLLGGLAVIVIFGSALARAGLLPPQFAIPWEEFYK